MMRRFTLTALLVLACAGCRKQDAAHSHDGAAAHAHAPGEHAEDPRPALSVTVYESGLELFMEYPALVVGQPSPLAAHLTDTRDPEAFRPVTRGRVVAVLAYYVGGGEERFVADGLLRDGIFKPVVTPTRAGAATLTLELEGEQLSGTVHAGEVVVHPDLAAAIAAAPRPGADAAEETVPFLKEQQWKTRYATVAAEARVLQGGVRANGELKPVAGMAAELSAPVAGRIPVGERVPHLGQAVKKGELLLRVVPSAGGSGLDLASVEREAAQARAELGLAQRDLARAEELFAAKAIPEKQLDAARVARESAAARAAAAERHRALYRSAQGGGGAAVAGSAFELRSPLEGVVSFADVMPGAVVEAGARLVSVVNTDRLWLEAKVFEPDVPKVQTSPGASFTVAGFERDFTVDAQSGGRRVAVGAVVDRHTRTVPVIFELPNPDGALKPGMFAKVTLFTGETIRAVAVPQSALVDDNGRPTVYVLEGGESFFKRPVQTGVRSGGFVQILGGVREGERVVSRGAYELKLAGATGAMPGHGHAH